MSADEHIVSAAVLKSFVLEIFRSSGVADDHAETWADILVFDPETIATVADFDDPYRYAHGIEHVVLNGELVLTQGQLQEKQAGKVLRA